MLRYQSDGNGPPLLLIHGFGISYEIWENLRPLLAPHFRLILVELPGIGQSPLTNTAKSYYNVCVEEIELLRQQLDYEEWSILSYSIGTRAAEAYIRAYPQRVQHAIFLCPLIVTTLRWFLFRKLLWLERYLPIGRWALSDWRLLFLVSWLAFNSRRPPEAYQWTQQIEAQPLETLRASLYDLPDAGRRLRNIPGSALFIWAKRDRIPNRPLRLSSRDRCIPGMHSAPIFSAPQIAALVIQFFESQSAEKQQRANGSYQGQEQHQRRGTKLSE